jgi:hypothetical protein
MAHDLILTRRRALGFTVLLLGCGARTTVAPGGGSPDLTAAIADGDLVDRALSKAMPSIATTYPALFSSTRVAPSDVTLWLKDASLSLDAATRFGASPSGRSMLTQGIGYLDRAMNVAAPITVAVDPALGPVIAGAAVLLAVMEQTLTPPQAGVTAPAATRALALAPRMSPEEARARLRAFTGN